MNKISTEHVTKNVNKNKNFMTTLGVVLIAITGLSILIFNQKAFTCDSSSDSAWAPRQNKSIEGYGARAKNIPSTYHTKVNDSFADVSKHEIEVDGIRETDEALTFAMSEFNKDMTYFIDFGNGTTKSLDDKSIAHVYQESGTYKVTVKSIHQGETKVISTKFLMVADAIETPAFIAEVEI